MSVLMILAGVGAFMVREMVIYWRGVLDNPADYYGVQRPRDTSQDGVALGQPLIEEDSLKEDRLLARLG